MKKIEALYQDKESGYFGNVRLEIIPLLPAKIDRVFEVGCGSGDTLAYIKSKYGCEFTAGLEIFKDVAEIAKQKVDMVIEGSIEIVEIPIDPNTIDVILCLDVLEHLVDPWTVVQRLHPLLKPDGVLICSIPNVRNFRVLLPLLLQGQWRYLDDGILDKTHLRFFTKKTAIKLAECSGLTVDLIESTGLDARSKAGIINNLTLSIFKPFLEMQYLIRAEKREC